MDSMISRQQILMLCIKALAYYDTRLVDHGVRVAYIVEQLTQGMEFSEEEKKELFLLSVFHDVGAYKTEEIDKMVQFETESVDAHSIYGYLFLEQFTPLKKKAEVIYYHHTPYREMEYVKDGIKCFAQLIHLADRIDIAILSKMEPTEILSSFRRLDLFDECYLELLSNNLQHDMFSQMDWSEHIMTWAEAKIEGLPIDREEADNYLEMLIHTVDFKSKTTMLHSVTATTISMFLGEHLKLSKKELETLYYATLVHDIGKIAISNSILESNQKLTADQRRMMEGHVYFTEEILKQVFNDEIVRIAIRHHEKVNGLGYPYAIPGSELSASDRIVAVADIVSALISRRSYKEAMEWDQAILILREMEKNLHIDKVCVDILEEHTKELQDRIDREVKPLEYSYKTIQEKFELMIRQMGDRVLGGRT